MRILRRRPTSSDTRTTYRHVISLGRSCDVARALRREGLRDASYPFDWNYSPLGPTLAMIESGFDGFLDCGALTPDPERPDCLVDGGSGISVCNAFAPGASVADQCGAVRRRFGRRIDRFGRATRRPTLFVRHMADAAECAYLDGHMDEVLVALRRGNPGSDLLLIGDAELPLECGGLPVYTLWGDETRALAAKLRTVGYPRGLRLRNRAVYALRSLRGLLAVRTRLQNYRRYGRPVRSRI